MGAPWHQLPAAYGKGNRFIIAMPHGCDRGAWPRLMIYLQADPDLSAVWLNSAVVSAAGAPQKGLDPALGRSRGGFSSRIRILADQRGRLLCLRLTNGSRRDRTQYTVMRLLLGYTIVLPVSVSPDEDRMSPQYVRHLTASKRQFLNLI